MDGVGVCGGHGGWGMGEVTLCVCVRCEGCVRACSRVGMSMWCGWTASALAGVCCVVFVVSCGWESGRNSAGPSPLALQRLSRPQPQPCSMKSLHFQQTAVSAIIKANYSTVRCLCVGLQSTLQRAGRQQGCFSS